MTISDLVQSSGWKNFMSKLYGFGAAVVIVGALFKIQHWPGASIMLTVGLTVEALIFFFSAFEPLHEEVDWTLVYPELAGITDDDEMENYKESITSSRGNVVLEKFENLFQTSTLSSETIEKLGEGFTKLSGTAGKLSDISEATVATQAFTTNFKNAAVSIETLTTSYTENSDVLRNSISNLSSSYQKTADVIEKSGIEITEHVGKSSANLIGSYQKMADSVVSYQANITENSKTYQGNLEKINKNLFDLNTLYELQLKNTDDQIKKNDKLYSGIDQMMQHLSETVGETKKYKEEMAKLGDNLAALNNIYGNMLSVMSYKK